MDGMSWTPTFETKAPDAVSGVAKRCPAMPIHRPLILILALATGVATAAQAQFPVFHGSRQVGAAGPQGEFGDNLDGPGYGLALFLGAQMPTAPVVLGIEGGWYTYSRSSESIIVAEFGTNQRFAAGHFVIRFQQLQRSIMPYAEAMVGLKFFYTETTSRVLVFTDQEQTLDDVTASYGVGGGLEFLLGQFIDMHLNANAGVCYLLGGQASSAVCPSKLVD